jgi:hypothetical protein
VDVVVRAAHGKGWQGHARLAVAPRRLRALHVGREGLDDGSGAQVDGKALDVEAGHTTGRVGERGAPVELEAVEHQALAHDAQVWRVEALLGSGLDRLRGGVR